MSASSTTPAPLYIETGFGASEPAGATSGSPVTRVVNGVKKWFWPTSSQALQVARASNPGAVNLTGRTPDNNLTADVIGGALLFGAGGLFTDAGAVTGGIEGGDAATTADTTAGDTAGDSSSTGSGVSKVLQDAGQLGLAVLLEQWVTSNIGKALTYIALFLVGVGLIGYGARGLAAGRTSNA